MIRIPAKSLLTASREVRSVEGVGGGKEGTDGKEGLNGSFSFDFGQE
jgi:hypothetical protein